MKIPTPTSSALQAGLASGQRHLIATGLILLAVVACAHGCVSPGGLDADAVAANNRGVALMGQFDYEAAVQAFEALTQQYPENSDIRVNLAIAILNRQKEDDENVALAILEGVRERDPENLRAIYSSGLLKLHLGQPEEALADFTRVVEADPADTDAAFFIGQCLMQLLRYEEALEWYRKSIAGDPYLRSAYYRAFQALQRLGQRDEALTMMQDFQRLEDNPRARLVEFKYTKMGRRGDTVTLDMAKIPTIGKPAGAVFEAAVPLGSSAEESEWITAATEAPARASITVGDIDDDGDPDLFIAGALAVDDGAANALYLAADGGYTLDREHPLAGVTAVNAALWGDFDNDGRTDVYLCRRGPNQLWRQSEPGQWQDVTAETQTANGERNTVDGALFDADHDGDLDLFLVNADGPNELLNNNRDGTFRPLAAERGLAGDGQPSRAILLTDYDGDRDADLILINETPPHEVYRNELLWEYRTAEGWDLFSAADVVAAVAGDIDADGRVELYTLSSEEVLTRWQRDQGEVWKGEAITPPGAASGQGRLALADVDGDGTVEVLISAGNGWRAISVGDGTSEPVFTAEDRTTRLAGWTPAVLEAGRGPAVVGWAPGGPPQLWRPGPGRYGFATLTFSGQEDEGAAMRSNASGIGTRVAVRVDSRWTVLSTFRSDSGPGQGLQPLAVGLGGAPRMDFVALDWSDGVFQTELALEQGTLHRITETQRQLSSCPVLFAWNGTRYEFVSDLLGVGGMGYAVGPPGEYTEPRPRENLMIPAGLLKPRDGRLLIKLTEPMEEIAYIDTVRLVAYDLPPGWSMTLDERMNLAGPEPSGKPVFYRTLMTPVQATNDRDVEVTPAIVAADLEAAPVGPLDHRFIGRLAEEHVLTLRFPEAFDAHPGQPWLVADGWVEYPYSQTNFAAWQAGAGYDAPTLEARGPGAGPWQSVLEQFGYPAGMPRQMSVRLAALPAGSREIRVRTNQEIYWDRLAVAFAEPCPEVERLELPLVAARLERVGFPARTDAAQRLPQYDYGRRLPTWDTRFIKGFYTRLGAVEELVAKRDDAVAIFGAGEEIHFEFTPPANAPRPGWSRIYVLETEGWCKDMDLFTRDGSTVEPIPRAGLGGPERERLHLAYNTRYLAGHE